MVQYCAPGLSILSGIFHHDFLNAKFSYKLRSYSSKKPLRDLALAEGLYTLLEDMEYVAVCERSFAMQVREGNITERESEQLKEEGLNRAFGLLALMTGESLN